MQRNIPTRATNSKIVREVHLLIGMKIRNIENQTNRLIYAHAEQNGVQLESISKGLEDWSRLPSLSSDEKILHLIEQYSTAINRLLNIRANLRPDNVMRVIELLSNDKFMHCSKAIIERALIRETSRRAALSVA